MPAPKADQRAVPSVHRVFSGERDLGNGRARAVMLCSLCPNCGTHHTCRRSIGIFGDSDDLKFHSSMTLFANATSDNQVSRDAEMPPAATDGRLRLQSGPRQAVQRRCF
jgi:hypothetical protein